MDFSKFGEYGFIGLIVAALFYIIWRILLWVMKWVDKQSEQHNSERTLWLKTLEVLNNSIQLHNQGSIEARKTSEDAHKYQREEHIKMMEGINKICNCLNDVKDGLSRINGYKS